MSLACISLATNQAQATAACRPASRTSSLLSLAPRSGKRAFRSSSVVRASIHEVGIFLAAAAEEAAVAVKPGDVQGGSGALIAGAIAVTLLLTAGIPAFLNPGNKAAEKIFDRDSKTGRR